jgi:LysR family transcriptional regulator, nitrogen assimilation regulatory protein
MDLKQLRYFVQISECGSLSRASEILRIAQPSLSLQLKNLEEELGVFLMVRHSKGVTLTELGVSFYDHAQKIIREVDQAKELIQTKATTPIGRVSVGLPTSACKGLAVPLMNAVERDYPRIHLHLVEALTGSLDEWIQAGRLDVALLYDHRAFANVAWTEMMIEELMLISGAANYFPTTRPVDFQQLSGLKLVLPSRSHILRTVLEQHAARAKIPLNVTIESDSLNGMIQFVMAGYSTILPHFAVAGEIERGELFATPFADPSPSWRLSVVMSKRTLNPRASQAVTLALAQVIKALVEKNEWRATLKVDRTTRHADLV